MQYSFFGMQLVIGHCRSHPFRSQWHWLITQARPFQSLAEKRELYSWASRALGGALPYAELGYWDYIATANAETEFDQWCTEIEASVAERRAAPPTTWGDYAVATMLFLLQRGGNSDLTAATQCDLPESAYFRRSTFDRLISMLPLLNFASIRGDALYLLPGGTAGGLAREELAEPGWEYLRPLGM